jgi:hypothetical protein
MAFPKSLCGVVAALSLQHAHVLVHLTAWLDGDLEREQYAYARVAVRRELFDPEHLFLSLSGLGDGNLVDWKVRRERERERATETRLTPSR